MPQMAIALVSAKGGTGKSTCAANLAVEAAKESNAVALLDLDPMGSLGRFWELRGSPRNPRHFQNVNDAPAAVKLLFGQGWEYVFIDSPPSIIPLMEDAISAATFCLIPVKASPIDLESIDVVVELCKTHNKPFAFVLNMFDPHRKNAESTVKYLKHFGAVLENTIPDRAAYVDPMQFGKTGPESQDRRASKLAAEEIGALWKAVKRVAAQGSKK